MREQELRAACKILGVQQAVCLDYGDGTLADVDPAELQDAVLEQFRGFEPDVVITFGDDGAYGHPDHVAISRATSDAFARALTELARPPMRLYRSHFPRSRLLLVDRLSSWLIELNARFTVGHRRGRVRSRRRHDDPAGHAGGRRVLRRDRRRPPGGPVGARDLAGGRDLPHPLARRPCRVRRPGQQGPVRGGSEQLTAGGIGGQEFTTTIDVADYVDRKVAAIAAHRTQFPIDPSMFPMPILQEMFGTEYFVRVWPPVEPETDLLQSR